MRGTQWQQEDLAAQVAPAVVAPRGLPPGQRHSGKWPVVHYGPLPRNPDPDAWTLRVTGATRSGREHVLRLGELAADPTLPRARVRAAMHCVNAFSVPDLEWSGWPASAILAMVPPRDDVTHVMAWAEFGYSANLPIGDLRSTRTVLAIDVNGEPLSPERGGPLRLIVPHRYAYKGPKWLRVLEYLTVDRRGFWEERGYHNQAGVWSEQRYAYQEEPGDGPPL